MALAIKALCVVCGLLNMVLAGALPQNKADMLVPTMPTASGLPNHLQDVLAYATIGIGTQNYTCSGGKYVQTELHDGPMTIVFDASSLFYDCPEAISRATGERLQLYKDHNEDLNATNVKPILDAFAMIYSSEKPGIRETFDKNAPPSTVFNMYWSYPQLYLNANITTSVPAPSPTDLDWAYYSEASNGNEKLDHGISHVYRVQTVGGQPPSSCSSDNDVLSLPFAAEYWIYSAKGNNGYS